MKRILKAQKIINLENLKTYILNYYVTFKNSNNKYVYGIEIEKYKDVYKSFQLIELESITNISYNYEQINNIVNLLANNSVTPITLIYILDDIIDTINVK